MKKRMLSLLLAAVTAAGTLTGCGGAASSAPASSEAPASSAAPASSVAASGEPMELTMYYPVSVGGGVDTLIDQLCADYHEENPNITVTPVYCGSYADTETKVQAALKAGTAPDLAIMFSIDLYSLLAQDAIMDIDSFCTTPEDKEWLSGFYDGFMMNSMDGDTTYGVPWQRSTIVMYYNKEAFKDAGLDPEAPPATWDELAADAAQLTQKDASGNVTRYGIEIPSNGYAYWMLQTFCTQQNGFNLMNDTGTETYYDDERSVKGLDFWKSLATDGSMPAGIVDWSTTPTDFINGTTAMMYHTTGNLTNVKNSVDFDFGVAMLPANESLGSPTGGGNFYIFKDNEAERQQAAFEFIQWMTEDERVAQWSIDTGYVATRPTAYETERMTTYAEEFPYCLVARDQLEHGYAELSTYNQAEVQKALDDAIAAVMTDAQDSKTALTTAQQTAENILKNYR